MGYPFTLHEDDDAKVVQISGSYDVNWGCTLSEIKAVFSPAGQVRLYHLIINNDETKGMEFCMNGQEVTALFEAWEAFKAEQILKQCKEEERIQDMVDKAQRMLADLPIFIEKDPETDNCWTIRSPELESITYTAYGADQLLERTKLAVADYERHQKEQAIHDQVKAIKEGCKAIKIRSSYPWHVTIDGLNLYSSSARTPEQLLEQVKAAAATYDRWLAEEDLRLQKQQIDHLITND